MLELALHVLDILQNSVEAGATRVELTVDEDEQADLLKITVTDNGRGMDERIASRVLDPFYTTRTTRHVGLGLPLYAAAAETAGGCVIVHSSPGRGTTVEASFQLSHLDRQPLGDMRATLVTFLLSDRAPELVYAHRKIRSLVSASNQAYEECEFTFDTADIRAQLDGVPLSEPVVTQWLEEFIAEGETSVR